MKKLFSIILLFAALLVSGSVWGETIQNVVYRYPIYNTPDDPESGILDWYGGQHDCEAVVAPTKNVTWGDGGETWYVVNGTITANYFITIYGHVHLILSNGCLLTSTKNIKVTGSNSLTIYGQTDQTDQMGKLIATSSSSGNAGIGGSSTSGDNITINGGWIEATGTGAAGIGGTSRNSNCPGQNIVINGGVVKAKGASGAAGIGGGGEVLGSDHAGSDGKNIIINGGEIEAEGGSRGTGIGAGGSSERGGNADNIRINGGLITAKGGEGGVSIGAGNNGTATNMFVSASLLIKVGSTEPPTLSVGNASALNQYRYAKIEPKTPVKYIDAAGIEQDCKAYTPLNGTTTNWTLNEGWYIVSETCSISSAISITGNVNLILADGVTLTVDHSATSGEAGIHVSGTSNSLTIYGQQSQTGRLVAKGGTNAAGIGGNNGEKGENIAIHGGFITVAGGENATAIGNGVGASSDAEKIFVNSMLLLKADNNTKPLAKIEHSSDVDIASQLINKRYAVMRVAHNIVEYNYPTYVDDDATKGIQTWQTGATDEYFVITSETTTLSDGWYVLNSDVTIDSRITVSGDVHIILCDGCTLTANEGISVSGASNSLTIYDQAGHSGKLIAQSSSGSAIGDENITINGGIITATSTNGSGIGANQNLTINSGVITANGTLNGLGGNFCNNVIINDGTIVATGGSVGIGVLTNLYINGGVVTATGVQGGIGSTAGGSALDGVYIRGGKVTAIGTSTSSYGFGIGGYGTNAIYITGGDVTAQGAGEVGIGGWGYWGGYDIHIDGGVVNATGAQVGIGGNFVNGIYITGGAVTASGGTTGIGATAQAAHACGNVYISDVTLVKADNNNPPSTTISHGSGDVSSIIQGKKNVITCPPITYINANGQSQTCTNYIIVTSNTEQVTWTSDWYVVFGDVTMDKGIVASGAINLIVVDGAILNTSGESGKAGINVSGSSSLTIYGQSKQSGCIIATGGEGAAGIGGIGHQQGASINIVGCKVIANGGEGASAIGSGANCTTIASNISTKGEFIVKADGSNPPVTIIEHGSNENIASKLNGQRYAIIKEIPNVGANPLCFTATETSMVQLTQTGGPALVDLWYSLDGKDWERYTIGSPINLKAGESVYFSAGKDGNATFSQSTENYYQFKFGTGDIAASGNVMSLLDASCQQSAIPCDYCFYKLFENCASLSSAPELPATKLDDYCYSNMFNGCSNLIVAPTLPAETLVNACYEYMFTNCTKLNYIRCQATNITNDNTTFTTNWVLGIASTGTFVSATGKSDNWPSGNSGIPASWVIGKLSAAVAWNSNSLLIETSTTNATKVRLKLAGAKQAEVKDLPLYIIGNTGGLYNIPIADSVLNHAGEDMMVDVYIPSPNPAPMRVHSTSSVSDETYEWREVKVLQVPQRITASIKSSTLANNSNDAIWVGDGTTLTIDDDFNVNAAIYVSPNGVLVVDENVTLTCDSLILRAGMVEENTYEFKYPQLVVNGFIKASKYRVGKHYGEPSVKDTIYYEYFLNSSQFYSISLPYDVDLNSVRYLDGSVASFGVQEYDESARSVGNTGWTYIWSSKQGLKTKTTMSAGKGYVVYAFPEKIEGLTRRTYSYIRFPMQVDLSNGEHPVASNSVTKTGNSSEASGWNLIGQPYLSNFAGSITIDGVTNRYVVFPSDNGLSFTQAPIVKVALPAFKNYFVQAEKAGEITFTPQLASAPMRELEANKEIMAGVKIYCESTEDDMGLLINNKYSAAYETNADLAKWMNTGLNLYAIYGGNNLSVVATSESEASNSIPLVVKTDIAGTYTFARATIWEDNVEELEHLYLFDASETTTTDLLTTTYEFEANVSEIINDRFFLSAIRRNQPTDMQIISSNGGEPIVISGRGHLAITNISDGHIVIYAATGAVFYQGLVEANKPIALPQGLYVIRIDQEGQSYTSNGVVY